MAMAASLEELRAAMKRAVELVDQEIDRLVGVLGGDAGEQIGAADFNMALGHEDGPASRGVVFEIDANAIDVGGVAEELFGFSAKGVAKGVGVGEVDSAKKDLRAGVRRTGFSHCTKFRPAASGRVPYNEAGDLEAAYV